MAAARRIERLARRVDVLRVPQLVPDEPGLVTVDATWGTISPLAITGGAFPLLFAGARGVFHLVWEDYAAHTIQTAAVRVGCAPSGVR
jgi:hypothetical protein